EMLRPLPGGDRRHKRDRAGGHGHDPQSGDHLRANRVYDRVRAPLRLSIRMDDGLFDHRFDAGLVHADADVKRAAAEKVRSRAGNKPWGARGNTVRFLERARAAPRSPWFSSHVARIEALSVDGSRLRVDARIIAASSRNLRVPVSRSLRLDVPALFADRA